MTRDNSKVWKYVALLSVLGCQSSAPPRLDSHLVPQDSSTVAQLGSSGLAAPPTTPSLAEDSLADDMKRTFDMAEEQSASLIAYMATSCVCTPDKGISPMKSPKALIRMSEETGMKAIAAALRFRMAMYGDRRPKCGKDTQ